ncbi:MAG: response regulator transcription factor [Bdellovibrionaceae bacterium]|jgi:DNA-binding response OmpR family regulator|nr:response regulator transcription factor [Pseudobdellovibrionaceae bacterium]
MKRQRLLIIEDAEEIRDAIKEVLDKKYEVTAVGTGAEALKEVSKKFFTMILMDVGLPDYTGFELWEKIQRVYKSKKTAIFFLTGRDDDFNKITAFSLGADDYLVKPFNLLEMEARVDARMQKLLDKAS